MKILYFLKHKIVTKNQNHEIYFVYKEIKVHESWTIFVYKILFTAY